MWGVVTPPRRDADRHGGLRAPETLLPHKGTRVAPQIFMEARNRDVGPDRRNVPWSPENVLVSLSSDTGGPNRCADPQVCGYDQLGTIPAGV